MLSDKDRGQPAFRDWASPFEYGASHEGSGGGAGRLMRALVFGETGQVPASWRARPRSGGSRRASSGGRRPISPIPRPAPRAVRAADADMVVNAAAYTQVDRAEDEPALAETVNAAAPGAMAAAAAAKGVPFLHVSTDYVFDGAPGRPWREDDPTGAAQRLWRQQARGRAGGGGGGAGPCDPAHRLGLLQPRPELRPHHAQGRARARGDAGGRRPARRADRGARHRRARSGRSPRPGARGEGGPGSSTTPARRRSAGRSSPRRSSRGAAGRERPKVVAIATARMADPGAPAGELGARLRRHRARPTASRSPTGARRSTRSSASCAEAEA